MKETNTRDRFEKYLLENGYVINEERTAEDKKKGTWFSKTISITKDVNLEIEVRVWLIIDVFTSLRNISEDISTKPEGYAMNVKDDGFSIQGFEVSLVFAAISSSTEYRMMTGDDTMKIKSSMLELTTLKIKDKNTKKDDTVKKS